VTFNGAKIFGEATFNNAIINVYADFKDASFKNAAYFLGTNFINAVNFDNTKFDKNTTFSEARFYNSAHFEGSVFSDNVTFMEAQFEREVNFSNVTFKGIVSFMNARFKGESLSFKDAAFSRANDQENACVKAKKLLDEHGKRDEADYHFFREMEGRRKQNGIYYEYFDYEMLLFCNEEVNSTDLKDFLKYMRYNILEYFVFQVIFGYGVRPWRIWAWWFIFVGIFAFVYWIGKGVNNASGQSLTQPLEYVWFSITVAVTPGFAGFTPVNGIYLFVAGLEAVFGTFMWAAFITTFAKKYMR